MMAVDMKVIGAHSWRLLVLLAGICLRFAQKHPCITATSLSLFLLYLFFPLVFKLVIYSSPIMVCAYAYRKNSTKSQIFEVQIREECDTKNDSESELVRVDGKFLVKERYTLQNRTIAAKVNKEDSIGFVPELQQRELGSGFEVAASYNAGESKDDGMKKASGKSESDILGKAENANMDDYIEEAKRESVSGELGKANGDDGLTKGTGEPEPDTLEGAEYEDGEETQDERIQEDAKQAVQWTDHDEKNLMDLGTSETERDRRLESLIQKRRARKLLSMQVRNVIEIIRQRPNQVAPLVIARSTGPLNLINTLSDTDDLHMPGSAPSVLLPTRSPFDLPYDPFEERPNLTGDGSFEQEFVIADQKDLCRHESFCLGGPFDSRQDDNKLNSFMNKEKKGMEIPRFSRFRKDTDRGSYESLSPGASSVERVLMSSDDIGFHFFEHERRSSKQPLMSDNMKIKVNVESEESRSKGKWDCDRYIGEGEGDSVHYGKHSGENQTEGNADSNSHMSSEDLSSYLHKSLASSMKEVPTKGAKENGHVQSPVYISSKDLFDVHKRTLHTPAHSIASDLVVEVSEAGSPPPTLSPSDMEPSQYDGDMERDITSGSEDMSTHLYRTEEYETRSLEGHESSKEGLAQGENNRVAIDLEEDETGYGKHTSPSSSDDNCSYENVVHRLTEKSKPHGKGKDIREISEEPSNPAETVSRDEMENTISRQSNPFTNATECLERNISTPCTIDQCDLNSSELCAPPESSALSFGQQSGGEQKIVSDNGVTSSSKQLNESTEKQEHGGSEYPVGQNVEGEAEPGDAEAMRNFNELRVPAAQPAEEVTEATSPKSVLPENDVRGQIGRIDSQPSLVDSLPDASPARNSISNMAENQTVQHEEDLNLMPLLLVTNSDTDNGHVLEKMKYIVKPASNLSFEEKSAALLLPKTREDQEIMEDTEGVADKILGKSENNGVNVDVLLTDKDVLDESEKLTNSESKAAVRETQVSSVLDLGTGNFDDRVENEETGLMEIKTDSSISLESTAILPVTENVNSELDGLSNRSVEPESPIMANDPAILEEPSPTSDVKAEAVEEKLKAEAAQQMVDSELQIHHITETCM